MTLTLTILGCGSSAGVPRPALGWGACDPNNPKNRRRRCSLLVERTSERGVTRILIDTSPGKARDVAAKIRQVKGVSMAHAVTGPHDIIAIAEAPDVTTLGELVVQGIQSVPGVNRSLTSIVAD